MDISINNVNFCGTREVAYSLKKAAHEARNAEICRTIAQGPHPIPNKLFESGTREALLNAYANVATFDEAFYETIRDSKDGFYKELKEVLRPEERPFSKIDPLSLFRKSVTNNLYKHKKTVDKDLLETFFAKITDKPSYRI